MSSEPSELALELVRRDADACVLAVSGELSLCSAGLVTRAVSKALLDGGRVLVDVSGLRLTRPSAAQLFPTTLMAVGGWPGARLVCQVPGLVEAGLSPADALPDGVVGVVERLVLSGWDEAEFAV
jgi:hypothetical protein